VFGLAQCEFPGGDVKKLPKKTEHEYDKYIAVGKSTNVNVIVRKLDTFDGPPAIDTA